MARVANEMFRIEKVSNDRFDAVIEWEPQTLGTEIPGTVRQVRVPVTRAQLAQWLSTLLTDEAKEAVRKEAACTSR